ncbi:MAG: hypothetical protein ABSF90_06695 [Syntrophobacteraceae bacterium]|jgi:hypothetical protein
MRTRRSKTIGAALALLLLFTASSSFGQEAGKQYKMTTPIPEGIAMPDKVETRLGTLKFFDGLPDDATVEKLYDNLDFQRAVQRLCWLIRTDRSMCTLDLRHPLARAGIRFCASMARSIPGSTKHGGQERSNC